MSLMTVTINPRDMEEVRELLKGLRSTEIDKVLTSTINTTMTGVVTDGTKILYDHYALPSAVIKASWSINRYNYAFPSGRVFCQGEFIRLKEFGAKKVKAGVSVKILREGSRETVAHAFFTTLGYKKGEQVYRRKWKTVGKRPIRSTGFYRNLPFEYRFPVKALYGPRIQDYLGDPPRFNVLQDKAGDRLIKEAERRVSALARGF